MTVKYTKNELRQQQVRLTQFQRYLPTLQLKKAMLQFEVTQAEQEIVRLGVLCEGKKRAVEKFSPFLLEKVDCDLLASADVAHVKKRYENIAGVEIPLFEGVVFREASYSLLDTPVWTDAAVSQLRAWIEAMEEMGVAEEKKRALEKELKEVSIRVNLFEKVLIPRAQKNIKKIRIFLGDQQLSAVAQAKVAKKKLAARGRA